MKRIVLLVCLFAISTWVYANPVSENTAKMVGSNFLAKQYTPGIQLNLIKTYFNNQNQPAIYVFGISNSRGFVIVSGDDAVQPILGYSAENNFGIANIPSHIQWWMNGYREQISNVMSHHIIASAEVAAKWNALLTQTGSSNTASRPTAVAPLLTTEWDQMPLYNDMCPTPGGGGSSTPTGCVATAMAQVMNYWQYPTNGIGSHTYTAPNGYGSQTANFAGTTYDWANMPTSLDIPAEWSTANTNAVATLMYHCGVGVEMGYDQASNGGSGAANSNQGTSLPCAQNALTSYFDYDPSQQGMLRADFSDAQWISQLKASLDNSRPIIYGGSGSAGGHCWVVDGYDDNNLFHCNWGWSGSSDGYFAVDNMNPPDLGTGGGGGGFNNNQDAIINIHPPQNVVDTPDVDTPDVDTVYPPTFGDLVVNDTVTVNNITIYWNNGFTITSSLLNNTDSVFGGDYAAAIYRSSDSSFVQYVQPFLHQSINAMDTVDVSFATEGIPGMLPGQYYAKLLYRKNGGSSLWTPIAAANSTIVNIAYITVLPNPTGIEDLQLDDKVSIYPNPATTAVTINLDKLNSKVNSVQLYSIDGKLISNYSLNATTTVPLGNIASGVYFVRFTTDAGTFTKKLVVKH